MEKPTRYTILSNAAGSCHVAMRFYSDEIEALYSGSSIIEALDAVHKRAGLDITWFREKD